MTLTMTIKEPFTSTYHYASQALSGTVGKNEQFKVFGQ